MLYLEQYNQLLFIRVLTLRGLILFFKILPISNTGDSTGRKADRQAFRQAAREV